MVVWWVLLPLIAPAWALKAGISLNDPSPSELSTFHRGEVLDVDVHVTGVQLDGNFRVLVFLVPGDRPRLQAEENLPLSTEQMLGVIHEGVLEADGKTLATQTFVGATNRPGEFVLITLLVNEANSSLASASSAISIEHGDYEPLWPGEPPGQPNEGEEDAWPVTGRQWPCMRHFPPKSSQDSHPHAAILVFPGGSYTGHADWEGEPVAQWLSNLGMDAMRAVRTVRARAREWNIDPNEIGVLGFSAGGHLAGSSAILHHGPESKHQAIGDVVDGVSCRPDFAVLVYPVVTLDDEWTHQGSMRSLLGLRIADQQLRDRLSLERSVDDRTPPVFVFHPVDDAVVRLQNETRIISVKVPVENALLLGRALRRSRVPFELFLGEQGFHGMHIGEDARHLYADACTTVTSTSGGQKCWSGGYRAVASTDYAF